MLSTSDGSHMQAWAGQHWMTVCVTAWALLFILYFGAVPKVNYFQTMLHYCTGEISPKQSQRGRPQLWSIANQRSNSWFCSLVLFYWVELTDLEQISNVTIYYHLLSTSAVVTANPLFYFFTAEKKRIQNSFFFFFSLTTKLCWLKCKTWFCLFKCTVCPLSL